MFEHQLQIFYFVKKFDLGDEFEFVCSECGFVFRDDAAIKFYDYTLFNTNTVAIVEDGKFLIYPRAAKSQPGFFRFLLLFGSRSKDRKMFVICGLILLVIGIYADIARTLSFCLSFFCLDSNF